MPDAPHLSQCPCLTHVRACELILVDARLLEVAAQLGKYSVRLFLSLLGREISFRQKLVKRSLDVTTFTTAKLLCLQLTRFRSSCSSCPCLVLLV